MSNIFTDLLAENHGNDAGAEFFLATVASVDLAAGVTIIPDGDTSATTKKYKILTSGNSLLAAGDRVVVMRHSGTCIILGKIGTPGDLADFVKKTGDTMTGDLSLQTNSAEIGQTGSEVIEPILKFVDKNGAAIGYMRGVFRSDGKNAIQFGAARGKVNNVITLELDANGNRTVTVPEAEPWRTAIGAVNKAGDTMSGNLLISKSGAESDFAMKRTDITIGTAPTADSFIGAAAFYDSANKSAGYAGVFYRPSKNVVARLLARNWNGSTNYSNYVDLYIAENGTAIVSMSHPAAWRSVLGLGTSGTLPITVGQGGTGVAGVSKNRTISDVITAASGYTFSAADYAQWGKIAMLHIILGADAADSSTGWRTVGYLKSTGARPAALVALQGLNAKTYALKTDGSIVMTGPVTATGTYEVTFTYLLN